MLEMDRRSARMLFYPSPLPPHPLYLFCQLEKKKKIIVVFFGGGVGGGESIRCERDG